MILYHISLDTTVLEKEFVPCIPKSTGRGENDTIPRICFAPSIKECIQAVHTSEYYKGRMFAVFAFEVDDNNPNLMYPEEIYKKGYVPDALENQEYWFMKPVTLKANIFKIESIDTQQDLAWSCIELEDLGYIIHSISKDPVYKKIVETSETSKECYGRIMDYAYTINDCKILDDLYDEISCIYWATMIRVNYVETNIVYYNKKEEFAL